MRAREFIQQIVEDQALDEVAMSPGVLKSWAASEQASGMMAGFEAELIFPDMGEGDSEPEYEPDYSYDPRPSSIDDVIEFFSDGEFADMSSRQAERIRDGMYEDFQDWVNNRINDSWEDEAESYIIDYVNDNDLFDRDAAEELAIDALGDDADPRDIDRNVEEQWQDFISDMLNAQFKDSVYQEAFDRYRDEVSDDYSEEDWLDGRTMSDIGTEWDLSWPHYDSSGRDEDGFNEENAERLSHDLESALGVRTKVSSGYHGVRRDAYTWIFEPDSSIKADAGDMPVEIVSPPMPLSQALETLPKFFEWAAGFDAYTNDSTGFHMSISMPDHQEKSLDFVKLALFLGDDYVLEQFGRAANTFTVGALKKIKSSSASADAEMILDKMRNQLIQQASRIIASSAGYGKYVSINPKTNYIEFRSAGGVDYFKDIDKVQNTLLRYARATSIALDPQAERQEYAKKFYKMINKVETQQVQDPKTGRTRVVAKPQDGQDAVWLFSRYVAGELPTSALKSFIKQLQVGRQEKKPVPATNAQGQSKLRSMPEQDQYGNFEIFSRLTNNSIWKFNSENDNTALEALHFWRDNIRSPSTPADRFGVRRVGATEPFGNPEQDDQQTTSADSNEPLPFKVFYRFVNRNQGTSGYRIDARNQNEARRLFLDKIRDLGYQFDEVEIVRVEQLG